MEDTVNTQLQNYFLNIPKIEFLRIIRSKWFTNFAKRNYLSYSNNQPINQQTTINLEVKFPFFSIKHFKNKKSNVQRSCKRFIEINVINYRRNKENVKILITFSKHFEPLKANKSNLLQLCTALLTEIPKLSRPTR